MHGPRVWLTAQGWGGHARPPGPLLTDPQGPEEVRSRRSPGSPCSVGRPPAHRPALLPLSRVRVAGARCAQKAPSLRPGPARANRRRQLPLLPEWAHLGLGQGEQDGAWGDQQHGAAPALQAEDSGLELITDGSPLMPGLRIQGVEGNTESPGQGTVKGDGTQKHPSVTQLLCGSEPSSLGSLPFSKQHWTGVSPIW